MAPKKEKEIQLSPFEQKMNDFVARHFLRVPIMQKILFVHNLEIMIKAGLSIVAALKILTQQVEGKGLQKIIRDIGIQVEKGRQLSDVLVEYPRVFPPLYVSMISSGEASGKMEEALQQVSTQMKKSYELTSRVKGALIYPAVVFTAMMGIALEMVVFVLPKIITMFEDSSAELPLPTKIMIALVNFMVADGMYLGIGLVIFVIMCAWLIRIPPIKKVVHRVALHIPIAGMIIKKINLARFTLTLSSLLQSSLPIIDSIKITSQVTSNVLYREALLETAEGLKKGRSLSEILLEKSQLFPAMVTGMINVGEESGQVEKMLQELAEYYGNEVDTTMKNFATIIEPVIILVMGLAVAGMAVSVIMPMYSLAQSA
jgi:type IV pilus assembly protein PilC